jgi:hypothetical protein
MRTGLDVDCPCFVTDTWKSCRFQPHFPAHVLDCLWLGSRRITGVRYRQALASPHFEALSRCELGPTPAQACRRNLPAGSAGTLQEAAMKLTGRAVAALFLAVVVSGCAGMLRRPDIADVQRNAGHYANRTVTVDGTVTSSWGTNFFLPVKLYKVDDGTGEITVLSRGGKDTPTRGSHVKVKGVVRDVAVFNGTPLGLHLEERDLDIKRN